MADNIRIKLFENLKPEKVYLKLQFRDGFDQMHEVIPYPL